ncbi:MAG: class I SAM-dependent methyltransferase [Magnetococcales bacterium]|nr:class I SAM-dependent methyltransferase [Magnetococcales bacterium]
MEDAAMQEAEFAQHAALEDHHWWFRARREILYNCFIAGRRPSSLLEIGCGSGGNVAWLSRFIPETTGIDIAPAAVAFARQRPEGKYLLGDFRTCPDLTWERYDLILLADVLEHIPDDRAFVEELVARMRPGACLVATVPALTQLWSHHDVVLGHQRRYTREQLGRLFADLPLTTLRLSYFNTLLFPLIALHRLLFGHGQGESSDLTSHGPWANALLTRIFLLEKYWLQHWNLPMGVSCVHVAQKRG